MKNIPRQRPLKTPWLPLRICFRHLQASIFALGALKRTPFSSIMTVSVIAISLALPAILFLLFQNIQSVANIWQHDTQISLFLEQNVEQTRIDDLRREISLRSNVMHVEFISPAQGLADLESSAGFDGVIDQLPENPLPPVLEVYPTTLLNMPGHIEALIVDLNQYPEVEASKLDMQWLLRLAEIVSVAKRGSIALILLLSMGVLLIVSNTIRLATYNRRHEIEVLKLIGATNSFIRRPFLYTGLFYGIFGALLAWIMIALFRLWLLVPVQRLADLYHSDFVLQGLGIRYGFNLIIFGAILGGLGAWLAVSRYIARIEPS